MTCITKQHERTVSTDAYRLSYRLIAETLWSINYSMCSTIYVVIERTTKCGMQQFGIHVCAKIL